MQPPAYKTAKGVGVVKAIAKTAGTITLDHEAIPEASWPAMTMGFKIAPPADQRGRRRQGGFRPEAS